MDGFVKKLTVGGFRALGIEPGEDLPDCAWVPADSVKLGCPGAEILTETMKRDRHLPSVTYSLVFTEPWRWIEVNGTIDLNNLEKTNSKKKQEKKK